MSAIQSSTTYLEDVFPAGKVEAKFRAQILDCLRHDPDFPTFPTTLAKLQASLSHPDTGFDKIAELIKLDPSLTARIFTVVRSAAFGGVEISSVEEALWRLGLKETRSIILAAKFVTPFQNLQVKIDWSKFWFHSLLTARLTQTICDSFHPVGDKEYLSGLLHDTGKLILAHYFPERFGTIFNAAKEKKTSLYTAEMEMLGTTHAAIGAALCHCWGLNRDIVRSIQLHHSPDEIQEGDVLGLCLSVANELAGTYAENIDEIETQTPPEDVTSTPAWKRLGNLKPRRIILLNLPEEILKAQSLVKTIASAE